MWNGAPPQGHLPSSVGRALAGDPGSAHDHADRLLVRRLDGFGFIDGQAARWALPGREYWLVRGPLELAAANLAEEPSEQSAHAVVARPTAPGSSPPTST